jgi:ketosteroid isomerase-like protein
VAAQAAVRHWVEAWSRAWPTKDPGPVAELFEENAVFRSQPFREEHRGPAGVAEYAGWAFEEQEDVEFWFGEPVVGGDRAAVEYWAVITTADGDVTVAGAAFLRFAPDGRIEEQRDYWAEHRGRREPPVGWGR